MTTFSVDKTQRPYLKMKLLQICGVLYFDILSKISNDGRSFYQIIRYLTVVVIGIFNPKCLSSICFLVMSAQWIQFLRRSAKLAMMHFVVNTYQLTLSFVCLDLDPV